MAHSDGWSNNSVDGSSVPRRSPSHVESSEAPIESSPADMSGASDEMAVPASSVAIDTSSFMSVFEEAEECVCPRLTAVPRQIDGVPGALNSGPLRVSNFEPR